MSAARRKPIDDSPRLTKREADLLARIRASGALCSEIDNTEEGQRYGSHRY